jgi:protein-S-isoprenylcysteine O-methyltransferase Ste14
MLDPQADPQRRKMVLGSQIIVAALVAGCVFFLLIVLLIVPGKLGSADLGPSKPLTSLALVAAFVMLATRVVVPGIITAQMLRPFPPQQAAETGWTGLFGVYQTSLIIKVAMLEGATFLLLITHMVERSPWTLALAVAFLLIILMHMPTLRRVDDWIQRQSRAIEERQ